MISLTEEDLREGWGEDESPTGRWTRTEHDGAAFLAGYDQASGEILSEVKLHDKDLWRRLCKIFSHGKG